MSRRERLTKELLVEPGTEANIAGRDPAWTGGPEFEELSAKQLSQTAKELLHRGVKELSKAQELLWASDTYALLVVFQALDAAGKDSTIKHVMSGVNPQGGPGRLVQATIQRGARPRLPLEDLQGAS